MDHIGDVSNPYRPQVEIPCLLPSIDDGSWYDNQEFLNFPGRRGWNTEQLKANVFHDEARQDTLAFATFAQNWLWFGLLSAFLGHRYAIKTLMQEFTTINVQGRPILTTRRLEKYLCAWRDNLSTEDKQAGSAMLQKTEAVLREANQHVSRYMTRSPYNRHPAEDHPMRRHPDVALAIQVLGVVLTWAKRHVWNASRPLNWHASDLVYKRLTSARWCPSDITRIETCMSPSGAYFVSLLPPRMQASAHSEACNADRCAAMNISDQVKANYTSRHVQSCDESCSYLSVDVATLSSILIDDSRVRLPLVRCPADGAGKTTLTLSEADSTTPFVAISHVWAERRGNVHANALPECQLSFIQNLVDKASGVENTRFWLDTLCIPQDKHRPDLHDLRLKAIREMDNAYKQASLVLVFDAELMSVSLSANVKERMVRFMCSNWIRRLWTMQEAVNGTQIMLQFADGTLDLNRGLLRELQDHPSRNNMTETLLFDLARFLQPIRELGETHGVEYQITRLWNASQYRSTSESQDEAICLGIILGFSPEQRARIDEVPTDERWRTFLLEQCVFPKEILFTTGPRVNHDGFRWAPESFIRQSATQMTTLQQKNGTGIADQTGFNFSACGMIFSSPRVTFGQRERERAFWLFVQPQDIWLRLSPRNVQDNADAWQNLCSLIEKSDHVAIILLTNLLSANNRILQALGVVARFEARRSADNAASQPFRCRYLGTVNVERESRPDALPILPMLRQHATNQSYPPDGCCRIADAQWVPEEQMWCVG